METEERQDVIKYAWLLSNSEPLDNMTINVGCTLARPMESLALARGVTWWDFALNLVDFCHINEHLAGSLLMWQNIEKIDSLKCLLLCYNLETILAYERYRQ